MRTAPRSVGFPRPYGIMMAARVNAVFPYSFLIVSFLTPKQFSFKGRPAFEEDDEQFGQVGDAADQTAEEDDEEEDLAEAVPAGNHVENLIHLIFIEGKVGSAPGFPGAELLEIY